MKITERRTSVTHRLIGPRHDPYDRETVTLILNDITYSYVTCALEDKSWIEINGRHTPSENPIKAFHRLTGLYPDEVREIWYDKPADPMGSLYNYI